MIELQCLLMMLAGKALGVQGVFFLGLWGGGRFFYVHNCGCCYNSVDCELNIGNNMHHSDDESPTSSEVLQWLEGSNLL